jgi:hypothetical protein
MLWVLIHCRWMVQIGSEMEALRPSMAQVFNSSINPFGASKQLGSRGLVLLAMAPTSTCCLLLLFILHSEILAAGRLAEPAPSAAVGQQAAAAGPHAVDAAAQRRGPRGQAGQQDGHQVHVCSLPCVEITAVLPRSFAATARCSGI